MQEYILTVRAFDAFPPVRFADVRVVITVLDADDHQPIFAPAVYVASVLENRAGGALEPPIARVQATDGDRGVHSAFRYVVLGTEQQLFAIDPETGDITERAPGLDREVRGSYTLLVDTVPPSAAPAVVTVTVLDVNDNPPVFASPTLFARLSEAELVGSLVARVAATDADLGRNSQLLYAIEGGNVGGHFAIHPVSGEITLVVMVDAEALRPQGTGIDILVVASDDGVPQRSATVLVRVTVLDENDNAPVHHPDVESYEASDVLLLHARIALNLG